MLSTATADPGGTTWAGPDSRHARLAITTLTTTAVGVQFTYTKANG